MDKVTQFFKKVFASPALIWKLGAGVAFIILGVYVLVMPIAPFGLDNGTRNLFAAFMLIYGVFRLVTFYSSYKNDGNE